MARCNLRGAGAVPAAAILALFLLSGSFFSCASSEIAVPFEKEARQNNAAVLAYQEGQRLEGEDKYAEAVESYTEALVYDKIRDAALYKIGRLSALSEDWERADGAFSELLRDDPGNTAVRQSLAYVYCQSGREEEGLEAYRELHEEKPHDEKIFEGYIKALKMNGLDEELEKEEAAFAAMFPHLMSK